MVSNIICNSSKIIKVKKKKTLVSEKANMENVPIFEYIRVIIHIVLSSLTMCDYNISELPNIFNFAYI